MLSTDTISIPAWLPNFLVGALEAAIPTLYTLIKQHITTKLLERTVKKLHERVDDINKALASFDKNILVMQTREETREEVLRNYTPVQGVPITPPRRREHTAQVRFRPGSAEVDREIEPEKSDDTES